MEAQIRTTEEKRMVGLRLEMSLANDRTRELWGRFMARRGEIVNAVGTDLYSMQVYGPDYFKGFDAAKTFEKRALAEVTDEGEAPEGMERFVLPAGLYAVFLHKGAAATAASTFGYIFGEWLPASEYVVDDRPHFEVIGAKYKNDDLSSEEEIWVPVRAK